MNEVGLNAVWLGEDLTHREDAGVHQGGAEPHARASCRTTRSSTATFTIWRLPRRSPRPTVWPSTTSSAIRISSPHGKEGDTPYYTNSSHLPVDYTADIFDALDIQDELQTLYTSGTVFHAFLGEKLPDWKAAANLVRKIAENYTPALLHAVTDLFHLQRPRLYLTGEHFTCPICGEKAEVYSRITGYYRPVQNWNDGKTQEYKNRKLYDIDNSCLKKVHSSIVTVSRDDVEIKPMEGVKYLFTTKTCPNCRMAKEMLKGETVQIIDAEENPELVKKYGIMQAPTLVIVDGARTKKYVNASNIKKYVDTAKEAVLS